MTKGISGGGFIEGKKVSTEKIGDSVRRIETETVKETNSNGESIWTVKVNSYLSDRLYEASILTFDKNEKHVNTVTVDEDTIKRQNYDGDKLLKEVEQNIDGSHKRVTNNTYDNDKLVKSVEDYDAENDGTIDYTSTTYYSYDKDGRLIQEFEEYDSENDGMINTHRLKLNIYDEKGRSIKEFEEFKRYAGYYDRVVKTTQYHENGKVAKSTNETGFNDYIHTEVYEYDENGNEIKTTYLIDTDNNGKIDKKQTYNYKDGKIAEVKTEYFDKNGELKKKVDDAE